MNIVERLKFWKRNANNARPEDLPKVIHEWAACFDVLLDCALATGIHTGSDQALMKLAAALESFNVKASKAADEMLELARAGG